MADQKQAQAQAKAVLVVTAPNGSPAIVSGAAAAAAAASAAESTATAAGSAEVGSGSAAWGMDFRVRVQCLQCQRWVAAPATLLQFASCTCPNDVRVTQQDLSNEGIWIGAAKQQLARVELTYIGAPNATPILVPLPQWNVWRTKFKSNGTLLDNK